MTYFLFFYFSAASMDVDRIMRDYDVNSLQDSIMGITFCDIEREIDTRMVDQNFVTVFKLAQLIIQYLLVSYSPH